MDKGALILSFRYAKAYTEVFAQTLSQSDISYFNQAADFFGARRPLSFFLETSLICFEKKQIKLKKIIILNKLPDSFLELCNLLIVHKRVNLITNICLDVVSLLKKKYNLSECSIKSADALSAVMREKINFFLHTKTGKNFIFDYHIDSSLIAGVRCQSEQFLWENSLQKKLRDFENVLKV